MLLVNSISWLINDMECLFIKNKKIKKGKRGVTVRDSVGGKFGFMKKEIKYR